MNSAKADQLPGKEQEIGYHDPKFVPSPDLPIPVSLCNEVLVVPDCVTFASLGEVCSILVLLTLGTE